MSGLDILVNVAGKQTAVQAIADLTTDQFEATFRTNVAAMFWLCEAAIPLMPPGSTIINATSIQAYQPSPTLLDYASTKAAIVAFTKALAKQIASKGIRVNAVAPGPVWTPLQPSGGQPADQIPSFGSHTPIGRPGQPAELAPIYVLLASQESNYVTAEIYGVTGGGESPALRPAGGCRKPRFRDASGTRLTSSAYTGDDAGHRPRHGDGNAGHANNSAARPSPAGAADRAARWRSTLHPGWRRSPRRLKAIW